MTEQKLISKADFGREVGVVSGMVSKLVANKLANAMVGKRIDMAHPCVELYLAERKRRLERAKEKTEVEDKKDIYELQRAAAAAPPAQIVSLPPATPPKKRTGRQKNLVTDGFMQPPDDDELGGFGDMKLKTILKRYGTMTQFKDLLASSNTIETIVAKRIANAKSSGDLISREHVHTFVFGAIEAVLIRLIQDAPRSIVARVASALESGETIEECEVIVRSIQSSQIKGMKKEVTKGLKSA